MSEDTQMVTTSQPEIIANMFSVPDLSSGILASKLGRNPELQTQLIEELRPHPILQQFNEPMEKEVRESFGADIKLRGVVVPIQVNQFGEILDGVHRYEEAKKAGLKEVPTQIFYFMSDDEQELHIYKANWMRKKLSTQHKYITIARISSLYEKGRGGDRSKSKEVSDTSLQDDVRGDVLEETSRHLGISPEQVKTARRYAKLILMFPKYHKVEPTKFLNSIVPLQSLTDEYFRQVLTELALDANVELNSKSLGGLQLYDRLLCACNQQKKKESAAKYIIACMQNRRKIDASILASKLGSTIEKVMEENTPEANRAAQDASPTTDKVENNAIKDQLNGNSDSDKTEEPDNFKKAIGVLLAKRDAVTKQFKSMGAQFDNIAEFSDEHTVSIQRIIKSDESLQSMLDWLTNLQSETNKLIERFLAGGYSGGNDDPLDLFPPISAIQDISKVQNENQDNL